MSICTHCGRDHDATGGVCTAAPGKSARALQISNKTMFGVPPAPVPLAPKPAAKAGAVTLPAPAATKIPPSARPPLPTAEEARQNPNLVISLEVSPSANRRPAASAPPPPRSTPVAQAPAVGPSLNGAPPPPANRRPPPSPSSPPLELDRSPSPDAAAMAEGATAPAPVDLPPPAPAAAPDPGPGETTLLPKPGEGPRMALPEPPATAAGSAGGPRRDGSLAERLAADAKSVVTLLAWASSYYLMRPKQLFIVGAFLVLPTSILESCVVAGLTARAAALPVAAATVDFSSRKAELARRIQEGQSRGQIDGAAVAELAALTTAETAPPAVTTIYGGLGWLRTQLVLFVQGFLILGIAFPIACGALALAFYDREGGGALPAAADLWPVLVARAELFLVSLVPAALLVAIGNSLFVVPGLVLSVLFLFLPHVVMFEKRGGRAALARSVQLVRQDAVRSVLTLASFALAGAVIALLAELLLPSKGSRALAFLHFIACDVLSVAVLPIPALVLARLYLDLRGGGNPERLSRSARA